MISKPHILFFNPVRHALAAYQKLSSVAQTEILASKSRAELFQDFKVKYNNITAIYSTSSSYAVRQPL
jgi:glyoxylate reductase